MTTHIAVFVGAGPTLSTEFMKLGKSFGKLIALAPASPKGARGTTEQSIALARDAVWAKLKEAPRNDDLMKLSVWAVEPSESAALDYLLLEFGLTGWIELLRADIASKEGLILEAVRKRMPMLPSLMAPVSEEVYSKRKSSPFPLPFRNFHSRNLDELKGIWYRGLDQAKLEARVSAITHKFRQAHTRSDRSHLDERKLVFAPAENNECHGKVHPTGMTKTSFIHGRFRFGSALYPGFHYDVRSARGNLDCLLLDGDRGLREMKPEKREYINIYPNDTLLPAL